MIKSDQWRWLEATPPQRALGGLVPPVGDREAWSRVTGLGIAADVLATAHGEASSAWPATTATAWLRFTLDGDREQYETQVFAKHAMLGRAVVNAACEPTPATLDHVIDGVVAFCEQSSWCWPAHDDARAHAERLPAIDRPYLDLGAGEVAAALAWTVHVLGPALEERAPGLGRRVALEMDRRVFTPFLERDDWHWLGYDGDVHNWLAWICGNVSLAALVIETDTTRRTAIVDRALDGLRRYADSLPSDGAIDEGSSYWWNGACRALEALEVLEHASAGAFTGWRSHPALRATIAFPGAMHLGHDWCVSVADATARASADSAWPSLFRLATSVGDARGAAFALAHRRGQAVADPRQLGRLLVELHDRGWWEAPDATDGATDAATDAPNADLAAAASWYPSVELLVARGGHGLSLVAKGGHNAEHHNHNDVGSIIVALDGVPVVVDPGRTTYTAQTFSPQRYDHWAMQSRWHSTPVVAGEDQCAGREYAARNSRPTLEASTVSLTLDLRDAYDVPGLAAWDRTSALIDGTVRITDRWRFDATPEAPSEVAFILAGDVSVISPREIEVRPVAGTGTVRLRSTHPWSVDPRDLTDPMLSTIWGERIVRAACSVGTASQGECVVTVEAMTGEEGA